MLVHNIAYSTCRIEAVCEFRPMESN